MYCHATTPQTVKPNAKLTPNKTADGMIDPFWRLSRRVTASNSLFLVHRIRGLVFVGLLIEFVVERGHLSSCGVSHQALRMLHDLTQRELRAMLRKSLLRS